MYQRMRCSGRLSWISSWEQVCAPQILPYFLHFQIFLFADGIVYAGITFSQFVCNFIIRLFNIAVETHMVDESSRSAESPFSWHITTNSKFINMDSVDMYSNRYSEH